MDEHHLTGQRKSAAYAPRQREGKDERLHRDSDPPVPAAGRSGSTQVVKSGTLYFIVE